MSLAIKKKNYDLHLIIDNTLLLSNLHLIRNLPMQVQVNIQQMLQKVEPLGSQERRVVMVVMVQMVKMRLFLAKKGVMVVVEVTVLMGETVKMEKMVIHHKMESMVGMRPVVVWEAMEVMGIEGQMLEMVVLVVEVKMVRI
ncbi:MAG: hypothetical protein CL916_10895 [Deltaproteobacteria bacterium]|nr:hypothetical protein [Deltaproteobacteria bacterium]